MRMFHINSSWLKALPYAWKPTCCVVFGLRDEERRKEGNDGECVGRLVSYSLTLTLPFWYEIMIWVSRFLISPPLLFSDFFFKPRDLFSLSVYAQLFRLDPRLKNRAKLNRFPISGSGLIE